MYTPSISVIKKISEITKISKYIFLYGGKRSGKTFSILFYLILICLKRREVVQVIAYSVPIINSGVRKDFEKILLLLGLNLQQNRTEKTYIFKNGSEIKFTSVDNKEKANAMGAAGYRFINECNMFSQEIIDLLAINCQNNVFFDFNPTARFWGDDYMNENNTIKLTWKDNLKNLTGSQINLYKQWTNIGQNSRIGSADYYRWQVFCEGNYCDITGDLLEITDFRFVETHEMPSLFNYLIMIDPSNANGGDNFAMVLTALTIDSNLYVVDTFSDNNIDKKTIYNKIKKWQEAYPKVKIYCENNGQIATDFINSCILSGMAMNKWFSTANKFQRIFANLDVFRNDLYFLSTPQNQMFAQKMCTFTSPEIMEKKKIKDDEIDCLNNAILFYILSGKIKKIFN